MRKLPPSGDILWLGAHKTGTTYLQSLLSRARTGLARAGLLHVGLEAFRSLYTRPVLDAAGSNTEPRPLPRTKATTPRYLIFDENIPALVQNVLGRTGIYTDGAERTLRLANQAGLAPTRIVLGIRSFESYLPSLYCEVLKSMPFLPFAEFHRTPLEALSWCGLIEGLCAAFPEATFCVYRAEDLKGHEPKLLAWICGLAPEDFPSGLGPAREGFSQKAIEHLHALHCQKPVSHSDLMHSVQAYPRSAKNRSFRPWSAREARDLQLAYELDLEAIGKLNRVQLWHPQMHADTP